MKSFLTIVAIAAVIGAIAYDQWDNHQFAVEHQHQCDAVGC